MRRCAAGVGVAFVVGIAFGITPFEPGVAKLIEQKPIFDTSVLPKKTSPFKLQLKHTALVYPEDLRLRNGAKVVNLQGNGSGAMLQGGITTNAATTPIMTVQRGVTARFGLDLQKLLPKIAPDLSRQLQAQIDKAERELAARAAQTPEEIRVPAGPKLTPLRATTAPTTPDLTAKVDKARKAATPSMPEVPRAAIVPTVPGVGPLGEMPGRPPGRVLGGPLGRMPGGPLAGMSGGPLDGMSMLGGGNMPDLPDLAAQANLAAKRAAQNVDGKLTPNKTSTDVSAKMKLPPNATNDLSAQLAAAKAKIGTTNAEPQLSALKAQGKLLPSDPQSQLTALRAQGKLLPNDPQSQLAALRAQANRLPPSMPSIATDANGEVLTGSGTIIWDAWHKQFAKLAGDALLQSVNKLDAPLGVDEVSVTIYPDNRLQVSLTKRSNEKFDQAVLDAYKSLDRHTALTFPTGSLRSSVSFTVENKHTAQGIASVVNSKTLTGDREARK